MRLLLAEDDASVREALVEILRQNRYEVDAVGDGRTAWECLKAGRYDGAVLDIMMPGMDGLSVLRRVREGGGTLPVLLLSARDGVED
ncbi:MAG: response regulator, partial [Christensenellales bacterium]|nr:response regulator [Christensenellales bacterium]